MRRCVYRKQLHLETLVCPKFSAAKAGSSARACLRSILIAAYTFRGVPLIGGSGTEHACQCRLHAMIARNNQQFCCFAQLVHCVGDDNQGFNHDHDGGRSRGLRPRREGRRARS